MPTSRRERLNYGPAKYAAFHLLLCRWMRHYVPPGHQFQYVTLGGTELRDIQSLHYVDDHCTSAIVSYELGGREHGFAMETRERLGTIGLNVDVRRGDMFTFERVSDVPHLFFIDVKGCFVLAEYEQKVAHLLRENFIRPGDTLLITSHLGARRGWDTLLAEFTSELDTLEVEGMQDRKLWFRTSHASFTLFRALYLLGFHDELSVRCFGRIEYRDKSPMSVFGYTVAEGRTSFHELVQTAPYFHIRRGLPTPPPPAAANVG